MLYKYAQYMKLTQKDLVTKPVPKFYTHNISPSTIDIPQIN